MINIPLKIRKTSTPRTPASHSLPISTPSLTAPHNPYHHPGLDPPKRLSEMVGPMVVEKVNHEHYLKHCITLKRT